VLVGQVVAEGQVLRLIQPEVLVLRAAMPLMAEIPCLTFSGALKELVEDWVGIQALSDPLEHSKIKVDLEYSEHCPV
jgi:hypothetical protein